MQHSKWITLVFGSLCLVAVATVLQSQHLFYMAALLLTLPGVSYAMGWFTLRGLTFQRKLPASAWEGETAVVEYQAANPTHITRFFISMQESWPDWINEEQEDTPLLNVPAAGSVSQLCRLRFERRGCYSSSHFSAVALDPLGVFSFSRNVLSKQELVVYPAPCVTAELPESGAERFGWQSFVSAALRGASIDPDGVRTYVPGDPLRHIHWRQTARTGRLNVMEFEETYSIHLILAIETQLGTNIGPANNSTLDYAARLAAWLANETVRAGASLRLMHCSPSAGSAVTDVGGGKGEENLMLILDTLARMEDNAEMHLGRALQHLQGPLPPGSVLLALTSTADPDLAQTLSTYTAQNVNCAVVLLKAGSSDTEDKNFLAALAGAGVHTFTRFPLEDHETARKEHAQ